MSFFFYRDQDSLQRPVFSLSPVGEQVSFTEPYVIRTPSVTLGSAADADITLDDPRVAPRHCRVELTEAGVYLVDLNSPQGTYLNGKRITRALLREGDSFRLMPQTPAPSKPPEGPPAPAAPAGAAGSLMATTIEQKTVPLTQLQRPDALLAQERSEWAGSTLRFDSGRYKDRDRLKVEVLLSVSTALARPDTIENRLGQIVGLMLQIMDFDRAGVWVLDQDCPPDHPEPRFAYQTLRNREGGAVGPEVSTTIIRKALTEEHGLMVKDALFSSEFGGAQSVRAQAIRTCVCFPLRTSQRVMGVLYADSVRPMDDLAEEELSFVAAFAATAAVAVENTLLSRRIAQEAVLRSRFERFFAPSTMEAVIRAPESVGRGGQEMDVTVLFCDIRNYTSLSLTLKPRQVAAMLNDYFSAMVKIVFQWSGTLEKYIGDALVAIWGAPFAMPLEHQSVRALQASAEMQRVIQHLNQHWAQRGQAQIDIGIGVSTGRAFVGNIGDDSYLQYAAIGSTTNLAARLCSCAGPGEVILSQETLRWLPTGPLKATPIGNVSLKGFAQEIPAFRLVRS